MTTPQAPGPRGLRIGFVPGVTLTKWRRIWAERFPRVPLEVTEVAEADQRRALDDGVVDMCFVRLPMARDGVHAIPLYDEVPVVWLSKDHVLAELDEFSEADLADENVLFASDRDSIDLATYSAAVLRVPMSIARSGSRKDLVYRPVIDAAPTTVALAWPVAAENPWIEEFVGVVRGRTANSSRTAGERARRDEPARKRRQQPPKRQPRRR